MAEQAQGKTPEQEKKEKEKQELEYRFNRQINFYIMRHMWQVVRGRNANDRIYECFGMSRERYTRAINSGKIRCSDEEAKQLEQLTGVSGEVFQGVERIEFHSKKSDVSQEEWGKLFAWRNGEEINGEKIDEKTGSALEKKIHTALKEANRTDTDTRHFYRLCYFLKRSRPAPLYGADKQIRVIRHALGTLSFELALSCDIKQLRQIKTLLQEKTRMLDGIIVYREEEKKAGRQ